jgi:hypothetical protein
VSKLELIENKARVTMGPVLKQIRKLHQQDDSIRGGSQKEETQGGENALTLKEAVTHSLLSWPVNTKTPRCRCSWPSAPSAGSTSPANAEPPEAQSDPILPTPHCIRPISHFQPEE